MYILLSHYYRYTTIIFLEAESFERGNKKESD